MAGGGSSVLVILRRSPPKNLPLAAPKYCIKGDRNGVFLRVTREILRFAQNDSVKAERSRAVSEPMFRVKHGTVSRVFPLPCFT